jgi:ATP-dependent exoDNAse (exonuclease V) beta subunit
MTETGADIVAGRIVHRLFTVMQNRALDADTILATSRRLALGEAPLAGADVDDVAGRAARAFARLRDRADLSALFAGGDVSFEVPFTRRVDVEDDEASTGVTLVRGSIDCLVRTGDAEWTVVEFKTGREAAWHARQLAMYVDAVRAMRPDAVVQGRLIYADADKL